jgi:aminoglycoside phosphotransferase (APT) family kinase protein
MLSQLIQRPNLERDLEVFRAQWRRNFLMHGDISWENVIVSSTPTSASDLLIVDWEMADIGDSGWDIGVVLRSFLSAWILAGQRSRRYQEEVTAGPAPPPFDLMRALTLAFWIGYERARGFDAATSRFELERGMRFAALQLAFVALEIGRLRLKFHSSAIEAVDIAFRLFQDPQPPVRNLLGA